MKKVCSQGFLGSGFTTAYETMYTGSHKLTVYLLKVDESKKRGGQKDLYPVFFSNFQLRTCMGEAV